MSERPYPNGIDCLWIASDRNGHLAAFVTGGEGPIPIKLLLEDAIRVEDIGQRVCELPVSSAVKMLVQMKFPEDFMELAKRGVFVYDWTDVHRVSSECRGAYEPVAVPLGPTAQNILPPTLMNIAKIVTFTDVAFSDNKPLDVRKHEKCRYGEWLS